MITTIILYYFCLLPFYLPISNIHTIIVIINIINIIVMIYYHYFEYNLQSFCPEPYNFVYYILIYYCLNYDQNNDYKYGNSCHMP